jgi:predicted dehydrogenase
VQRGDEATDLGVVVVGTGFGARVHVPALQAAGFTVRALVGRDPERTARRAQRLGVPTAGSLEEALAWPGVDAVTVATPPATHCALVLQALDADKHVLCEKPFAADAAEAKAMLAAAEVAGVVHMVGHEFRWLPERALVGRLIGAGAIGEPRLVSLVTVLDLVADPATRVPDWWFDPARGGGWLGASGSHLVDQVRAWLGDFGAVSGALTVVSDRPVEADDSFSVLFRLRSGVQGVLQQSAGAWGPPAGLTWVGGREGTVWIDGTDVWLADRSGPRRVEVPADLRLPPPSPPSDDPRHRFTALEIGPFTALAARFRDDILGRPAPPSPRPTHAPVPATFADGLATQLVLDAVRQAAARPEWQSVRTDA